MAWRCNDCGLVYKKYQTCICGQTKMRSTLWDKPDKESNNYRKMGGKYNKMGYILNTTTIICKVCGLKHTYNYIGGPKRELCDKCSKR